MPASQRFRLENFSRKRVEEPRQMRSWCKHYGQNVFQVGTQIARPCERRLGRRARWEECLKLRHGLCAARATSTLPVTRWKRTSSLGDTYRGVVPRVARRGQRHRCQRARRQAHSPPRFCSQEWYRLRELGALRWRLALEPLCLHAHPGEDGLCHERGELDRKLGCHLFNRGFNAIEHLCDEVFP